MKNIIKAVIKGMSQKVNFYFGMPSETNLVTEEESSDVIGVLLMYEKDGKAAMTKRIDNKYYLNVLFLKKSNLDDDFETRGDDYLSPMEALGDEFVLRLSDYFDSEIKPKAQQPIETYKTVIDRVNQYDVNFDGVLVSVEVPKVMNVGYCLENYTFTISSDGSAVANNFTWNHTIDEVSSDGVTFASSASYPTDGFTMSINAGSATTGNYTFTPLINADYSATFKTWAKWSDGTVSIIRFKVNYAYVE